MLVPSALIMLSAYAAVEAANIERLFMPGQVIQGHAEYENECNHCHKAFSKVSQRGLCMDCHKKITVDIDKRFGFHGLSKDVKETECEHCHTEHKGRDADIVRLDKEIFDHKLTDFPLKGSHVKAKCAGCHKPKVKYRDTSSKCNVCHKDDNLHLGRLGEKCTDCHEEETWRKTSYNHNKTKFPLKGKHKKAACNRCHPNQRWKNIPTSCYACHLLEDAHGGRYGTKCENCHTPEDRSTGFSPRSGQAESTTNWKYYIYDHDKTGFPLKGKHRKVHCDQCHPDKLYKDKYDIACFACHKNDDEHKGRYGKECKSCHTSEEWKRSIFNHDKTEFPLKEKHRKVDCNKCHTGPLSEQKLGMTCYACHQHDDEHKGQEGEKCEHCHNQRGWGSMVFFDHDLARFPLIGLHTIVPCEECHLMATYKDSPLECVKCHKSDDEHKQYLGPKCGHCHNPNGWGYWRFDHNSQTDFDLKGAHEGMECLACHRKPVERKIRQSMSCPSCHQGDDVHKGRYGRYCQRCHVTKSFQEIRIGP